MALDSKQRKGKLHHFPTLGPSIMHKILKHVTVILLLVMKTHFSTQQLCTLLILSWHGALENKKKQLLQKFEHITTRYFMTV